MAPIDASDQSQIIRIMDEDDGVTAVRKRKNNNVASSAKKAETKGELKPLMEAVEA